MRIAIMPGHSFTESSVMKLLPLLERYDVTVKELAELGFPVTISGYEEESDTLTLSHPYDY
jgi:hypothetical protein